MGCALTGVDTPVERGWSGLFEVAESLKEDVILAVKITGDSDSTGAITCNLLGALHGVTAIPARWLASLEMRDVIEAVAQDLALLRHPDWQGHDRAFFGRYPGAF